MIAFQKYGPDSLKDSINESLQKLKTSYIRDIRLQILGMTSFFKDLEEEEEGKVRIRRFEQKTGISLFQ